MKSVILSLSDIFLSSVSVAILDPLIFHTNFRKSFSTRETFVIGILLGAALNV